MIVTRLFLFMESVLIIKLKILNNRRHLLLFPHPLNPHNKPYFLISFTSFLNGCDLYILVIVQQSLLFNSMPKQTKTPKKPLDQEEVQDIMAWGNRRENYYQQSEEEYSQSGQEEAEAQRLYQRQLEHLGNQELYQLPQRDLQLQEEDGQEEEDNKAAGSSLSHEYLTKEIARMAKLGIRVSEEADSKVRRALQTQIQAYLLALIGLRELKIPYIEYHPLFNQTIELKQDINKLRRLLDSSTIHAETNEGQQEQEEDLDEEVFDEEVDEEQYDQQSSEEVKVRGGKGNREAWVEIEKGLKIYEEAKTKQNQLKAAAKKQKKMQREANKKPAFLEVKDQEGRLASEKILKNKGLIKKRKKIDRNSRVKLRRKFDKATSKRRAYGHVIRQNPGRQYEGEKNIKYGRIASVKLK